MILILLLQAISFIQSSLLLKCGDVESNPGPELYPGKKSTVLIDKCCQGYLHNQVSFYYTDLDYDNVDSSTVLSKFKLTCDVLNDCGFVCFQLKMIFGRCSEKLWMSISTTITLEYILVYHNES